MDVTTYEPAHDDALIALLCTHRPGVTPEQIRHELADPSRAPVRLVAIERGEVVGLGEVTRPPWLGDRHVSIAVVVRSDRRGSGAGSTLHRAIGPSVPPGVVATASVADDDRRSLAIAQHWGFVVYQHAIQSQLTLTDPPPPVRVDGVELERIEVLEAVDDTRLESLLHEADTSPEAGITGTHGLAAFTTYPQTFAVVAIIDDSPVGITIATQSGERAHVLLTATHPEARRRGLAALLKRDLHALAWTRGVRHVTASNEAGNDGIRRLNAALGYERISGVLRLRRGRGAGDTGSPTASRTGDRAEPTAPGVRRR